MNNNSPDQHSIFKQGAQNYQVQKKFEVEKYYISETIKLSLVTAPLYCLSANLQYLDKNILQSNFKTFSLTKKIDPLSNFLIKNAPSLSIYRPFKPSYYINYRDAILNIFRQGYSALYKGNFFRLSFFISTNQLKKYFEYNFGKYLKFNKVLREILTYALVDFILHPLLFLESRFSIQPYRKGFRIYNSAFSCFKKSILEIYKGSLFSIPRNFVFVMSLNSYYLYPDKLTNIIAVGIAHVLSYPLLTIQRNIIFQSGNIDYLPIKESSLNVIKNIINIYGFMSLYRGFGAYILATGLWHYVVPTAANQRFYINLLSDEKRENNSKNSFNLFDEEEDEEVDDLNKVQNNKNVHKFNFEGNNKYLKKYKNETTENDK